MVKLLETWQGIRPYSQNHIICSIYVNTMVTHRPGYVHRSVSQNWVENVKSDCSTLQVSLHHSVPKSVLAHNVIQSEVTETPWPRHSTDLSSQTLPSLVDRSLQKPISMLLGKWELPLTWYLSLHVTGTTLEYGPATEFLHFSTKKSIGKCFPPFFFKW